MDDCLQYAEETLALTCANTRHAWEVTLKQWSKYLGKPLKDATAIDAVKWLKSLRSAGLSDNTLRLRSSLIRTLYKRLYEAGLIERNKIAQVRDLFPVRQRRIKRETRMLSVQQVRAVLNCPDENTFEGIQDRAMLALMFGAGLRRSEIQALNLSDVKVTWGFKNDERQVMGYVLIQHAKSGSAQKQSFGPWVLERLGRLMSERRLQGADDIDPLFVANYNGLKRIDGRTIARRFQRICENAGVEGWIAPHSARATAASTLKAMGHEDREVAHFLRHATVDMVQVYDKRSRQLADNPGVSLDFLNSKKIA